MAAKCNSLVDSLNAEAFSFIHPSIYFSLLFGLQAGESEEDLTGKGVLRLLLQPWESREVAVVFTPSDHKPTTTILIIR